MKQTAIPAGRIVNAHGVRGELRVLPPDGERADLLCRVPVVLMDGESVKPLAARRHKNFVLLKLPGVEDMDAALAMKGKRVALRREDAADVPFFDEELVGMTVHDGETGAVLGTLTKVEAYPASKVYTVEGEKTYLIPAVPEAFILSVDVENNRMDVRVWEGLATDEP